MRKKRVFISLPISGQEDTFFARTDAAVLRCQELFDGWDIITPKDINKVTVDMLKDHTEREKTAFYMGKDIEALINSDAIYSCKGWEQSKGCLVERRTAEVYGLELYTEE